MAIQVANLTAQVGADLTQFKTGMNEVVARLEQVESKAITTTNKVNNLRAAAAAAAAEANSLAGRAAAASTPAERARLYDRATAAGEKSRRMNTAADDVERDWLATEKVARAAAERIAVDARQHQIRAFNAIAAGAQDMGQKVISVFTEMSLSGAKYNATLTQIVHNTSLTGEAALKFRDNVAKMGVESGANLEQLARGMQKVENFSFDLADATMITDTAMKSSVATGSNMANTAELLAKVLVQFGMGADKATVAMNTMHVAANLSSLEMEQLVAVGGQTYSLASSLGVSFVEANAALVTFTKQGLNAHEAMTQFRNGIQKIVSPTEKVKRIIEDVAKKTGVDLSKAFTYSALKADGLAGAFSKIREAAKKGGYDPQQLANQLFPNLRGTIGAMILSGDQGFSQFEEVTNKLNEAFKGNIDPTTKQYNETLKETQTQINRAKNAFTLMTAEFSAAGAPIIISITDKVRELTKMFTDLSKSTQEGIASFTFYSGVFLVVAGSIGKVIVGLASLKEAMLALAGVQTVADLTAKMSGGFAAARLGLLGFAAAWGPWILGATVAIGLATALVMYINNLKNKSAEADAKLKEQAKSHKEVAEKSYVQAKQTQELIKQYETLTSKTKKTEEEKQKLKDVLNKIADRNPELIKGFDEMGNAIGLIGDYANYAAKNLHEMTVEAGRARAKATATTLQPLLDERAQLSENINRVNQARAAGKVIGGMYVGGGMANPFELKLPTFGKGSDALMWDSFSQSDLSRYSSINPNLYKEMQDKNIRDLRAWAARIKQINEAEKQSKISMRQDMKGVSTFFKPTNKTVNVNKNNHNEYNFTDPGKERDPLDDMRNYIMRLTESMYKLENADPLAEANWTRDAPGIKERLDAIKSMEKLYWMAADAATVFTAAQKRANEQKSYDTAVRAVQAMAHKPKSERLGDIARWEVGDPSKDRWAVTEWNDPLMKGPTKFIPRPLFTTGNDPSKQNWSPEQKRKYIDMMEAEQARKDAEKAAEQLKKLQEDIMKPLQKQKTVFEQTADNIREQTELYAELGETGTFWYSAIAQFAYDSAEAMKKAEAAHKKMADELEDSWKKAGDALIEAKAKYQAFQLETEGFGQQLTSETYIAQAAVSEFKKTLYELDPISASVAISIGMINKTMADDQAVRDHTSAIRELNAEYRATTMVGGDFQKWLMKTTGYTPAEIDAMEGGKYRGLTSSQYRDRYNAETDVEQANKWKQATDQLKQAKIELGMVKFETKEAKVAWEVFGTTFNKLSPEMQLKAKALAEEFAKMDAVKRAQYQWQTAAGILEDSFADAFSAVLDGQANFWNDFIDTFKSGVTRLIATEGAKEVVRYIGRQTGWDGLANAGMGNNGPTQQGQSTANAIAGVGSSIAQAFQQQKGQVAGSVAGTIASALNIFSGGKQSGPTPVYVVGMAPMLMGGLGTPPFAGGGMPAGGMGGFAGIGSMFGPTGTAIGMGLDLFRGLGFFAGGGRPMPNRPAVLGERGPEIWIPDRSGTILSNKQSRSYMEDLEGTTIQVLNTGDNHYHGDEDSERMAAKTAAKIERKLRILKKRK